MPRFVILRHDHPDPQQGRTHWDFMLEQAGVLRTWALMDEPVEAKAIVADALANHRLAYLQYEGPVSRDRGSVSRWDYGDYLALVDMPDEVSVRLHGNRLVGTASLRREAEHSQRWRFDFSADTAEGSRTGSA